MVNDITLWVVRFLLGMAFGMAAGGYWFCSKYYREQMPMLLGVATLALGFTGLIVALGQ